MPKVSPAIPDAIILAHIGDREKLSDDLWLIAPQLSMLLGRSVDQLDEDRKVGNPPPAMKPWGEKGPVRYKMGTVRAFMFGKASTEYNNTEHARQEIAKRNLTTSAFTNFEGFLANARPNDVWPITVHKGTPIDFFRSLGLDDTLTDEDTCQWMTLDEYLERRRSAAWTNEAKIDGQIPLTGSFAAPTEEADAERPLLELNEADLAMLASFFSSGKAASCKIFIAGDPPFPGRSALILRLVRQVAKHLGFHAEASARIVERAGHSRIHLLDQKMIGPFHELLAMHDPSQYLWHCENWTNRLERLVLESTKSHIDHDKIGVTEVKNGTDGPVNARTKIGTLVEALAFKVPSFDAALVGEIFPGLTQAVALLFDLPSAVAPEPTEAKAQDAMDRMANLYAFLHKVKVVPIELPPLSD